MAKICKELTIGKQLFAGGMATLTLGTTPGGRKVVLRESLPQNVFHWRLRRGFIRGTKIRERLSQNPNFVKSIERGCIGLAPYEIIEYLENARNLRVMISKGDPIIFMNTLEILRDVADALGYMFEQGFMHLDVKPENVLIEQRMEEVIVKVTDFDLSRKVQTKKLRYKSGTETAMAPEQLMHSRISPQVDVFSFGVLAYDLVTGRMPFTGSTKKERRWQQCSVSFTPPHPREQNPDISHKLEEIIMKCLEKTVDKRFANMAEVAMNIREI